MSFKAALLSGGKGGGSSSYRNAPDNLRSTDTFELLVGLGTGRMRLAPGGLQNLFINDVAVEDGQGKANFQDFAATLFDGDPTILNPIKLQLGSSAGSNNINLPLANHYTNQPGDWVTGAITQAGVDFIDLRFVVQQLYNQTKNGVDNATASIEVELRPSGAADWINPLITTSGANYNQDGVSASVPGMRNYIMREMVVDDPGSSTGFSWNLGSGSAGAVTVTGKTTSAYVKEFRVAVPNDGAYANKTWEIRCRLREIDYQVSGKDGENEVHRSISWESAAGAKSDPIGGDEAWRGLSYLQLFGKASDQITGIPEVTGIYDLDMYLVPPSNVWNPATRVYTGAAWDGVTTQLAWTQCPAFQIKGVIENDLSGVSALAPGSTLNKWDALEASKWFAQLVPDGKGGTHPRYSMNWFIEQPQSVNELVNYLAGAVGSFAWDEGDGQWRLKAEKPETPQVIFTKENIAGEFVYQHTDIDTRYNDITAVYRDRDNRYVESRVRVFNQADIDATGHRPTSIVLVGCDNRQEALRRAYIRLLTALNEKRMVTYKTNRIAGTLEPFSVVGIADGDLNSDSALRSTGRVVGTNLNRDKITLRDTLRLEPGVLYQVQLTVPNLGYSPDASGEPLTSDWRKPTITITRNVVNTAAQRGDVYDLYLDQPLPTNVPEFAAVALSAPGLPALPKQYRILGIQPDDDGEWATISAIEIYTSKWIESDAITEDAINAQRTSKTINPPIMPPAGMFRIDSYSTGIVNRRVLVASWTRPAGGLIDGYRVSYRYNGGPWIVAAAKTSDTFFELPDPSPGQYDFQIVTLDRRGIESNPLTSSTTLDDNAAIATTGSLSREVIAVATAKDGTGGDFTQANGVFTVVGGVGAIDPSTIVFSVPNHEAWISINATGNYTVTDPGLEQAQAVLRAVWNGITIEKTVTVVKSLAGADGQPGAPGKDATLNTTPPSNATGLGLSSSVEIDATGKPWIKLLAQWLPSNDGNLAGYTVALKEGSGSYVEFDCGSLITSFFWSAQANTTYFAKIRAKNGFGFTSAYSAEVTHVTAHDITPPGPPTSLNGQAAFQTIFLSWLGPTDGDLAFVEVYENSTNNSATATRVASVANRPGAEGTFTRTGIAPGTNKFYWLKAIDTSGNRSAFTAGVSLTTQQVFTQDISGQLADAQIAAVAASKVTGQLTDTQLAGIAAAKIAGTITATQIADGSISGTKFASGLKPVEVVAALPATGNTVGRTVILTTDNKMYRWTGTVWTSAVAATDITGQIAATQITDNSITSSKIAANTITAGNIAANTITGGQIAADTITAGNIAAGAITASELAAGAVTAGKIAADAITAGNIVAGSITAAQIAADTITAANIAANAITASELSAGAVTAGKIAAGTIQAGDIAANAITGDRIAANTLTAANIAAGTITGDRIQAGSIAADRLNVGTLSAISANIGLLRTAASGARTEIESNQIRVYDGNNVMRVRMGVW